MRALTLALGGALWLHAGPALAQGAIPLDTPVRVRHACSGAGSVPRDMRPCVTTGRLAFRLPDTLGVTAGTGPAHRIAVRAIVRIETGGGLRTRTAEGAAIGAAVALGALVLASSTSPGSAYAAPGAMLMLPAGALLGALVGRRYWTDVWYPVVLDGR